MERPTHLILRLLGVRIRELRRQRGWRQADLVAHLDDEVTDSALSFFERGERAPSLITLVRIGEALGVHPAVLLLDPHDPAEEAAIVALLSLVNAEPHEPRR